MTEIRIDNTGNGTWWLYNDNNIWMDYVTEDLTEKTVLFGNRDYPNITYASWWKKANEVIRDLENYDDRAMCYYRDELSRKQRKAIIKAYENCRYTDDTDFIIEIVKILYPEMELETATIRGYCQGDWQEVVYIKDSIDIDLLEAFYFGQIVDITVNTDEEEYGDTITDSELWKMEDEGLKEALRKRYDIPKDEELVVMQCDGYKQVEDWKEIC